MFKYVLSMILFGGLTLSGLLGGGLIGGCGNDGDSPLPSEREGQGEGESEGSPNEGEGEGSSSEGEGEGEGEGMGPPGADGEPCGQPSGGGNACQEGLECLTCEEGNAESVPDERSPGDTKPCEGRICTCPQWFEGRWWAEFDVHAVDYEYDFETVGGLEQQFWMDQEIPIQQKGCTITGPSSAEQVSILSSSTHTDGRVSPHPNGFYYKKASPFGEGNHWITFQGNLSADRQEIAGTCEGEFLDQLAANPDMWFHIACTFSLTRR